MDGRGRRQGKETYDLGVGFVGFFAVAFVGISLFEQLNGRDAVWASITALFLAAVLAILWWFRRRFLHRSAAQDEER